LLIGVCSIRIVKKTTTCLKKFRTPVIFWHNFIKTALISIKLDILGIENQF